MRIKNDPYLTVKDGEHTVLRNPTKKCCKKPDVKNEGRYKVAAGYSWEYHCYHCGKTWTELEK
jgi:hypothetical protein